MYLTEEQIGIAVLKYCELAGKDPDQLVSYSAPVDPSDPNAVLGPTMVPYKDTLIPQMRQFANIIEAVEFSRAQAEPGPVL